MPAELHPDNDGERYRVLQEALHHIIVVIDASGKISYLGPESEKITGEKPENMVGREISQLVVPGDRERLRVKLTEVKSGKSYISDYRLADINGEIHPVRGYSLLKTGTDGNPCILGVFGETDTWRSAEDPLIAANKKLEILSSITRHDINNQLTLIFGYLPFLEDDHPPLPPKELVRRMRNAATKIKRITRFTKEYQEIGIKAPIWQNLGALMDGAVQEVDAKEIAIAIGPVCNTTEILADHMAGKVFFNLLDNTLRHGGPVSTVRLFCQCEGESLKIVYEDDGTGIPAALRPTLFQSGNGRNNGYGLFLIREIFAITGFTIVENGAAGKGVRFEITVPPGMFRETIKKP